MTEDPGEASKISSLRTILDAASVLVRDLSADAQLLRLLRVFAAMPAEDRETILGVLEREVKLRRITVGTGGLIGWEFRPNPNARLYGRAFGPTDAERVAGMDVENMATALQRLGQMAMLVLQPGIIDVWREAVRRANGQMTDEERAANLQYASELMTLLAGLQT